MKVSLELTYLFDLKDDESKEIFLEFIEKVKKNISKLDIEEENG